MIKNRRALRSSAGFTMIEMLVVLVIFSVVLLLGFPALQNMIQRGKTEGIARETVLLMRQARFDAIKNSACANVRIADEPPRVEAFSDRNCNLTLDAGEALLGTFPLPSRVDFVDEDGKLWEESIFGLTDDPASSANLACFQRDGSVRNRGAFRFGDERGNFLEARVEPEATARVEVRKWREADSDWFANGAGGKSWEWY